MRDGPDFLDLPAREDKPRRRGLTHVLDKGASTAEVEGFLEVAEPYVDIVKLGWGIGYVDPLLRKRIALYSAAGIATTPGGTLLEVAERQGRLDDLRRWMADVGFSAIEISNGVFELHPGRKAELVELFSRDFVVLAETGLKDAAVPVEAQQWLAEMRADLDAGAAWVIAEGRESGSAGLYEDDGSIRPWLADLLIAHVPADRVIFEAPQKAQQTWFVRRLGADANLGNIPMSEVLSVETLRLGLRADTAGAVPSARIDDAAFAAGR